MIENLQLKLDELEEKIRRQNVKVLSKERYSNEFFTEQKIYQELWSEKEKILGKILTLKYNNKEVSKMTENKKIINTPKPEKKKPITNNFSQHRIEMFDKHKEDVKKMFKEKKKVSEINAFLRGKGALQDLASYILLRLKLKTMGKVPEKAQIKKDEAFIMAVNEKNKTEQKVKK